MYLDIEHPNIYLIGYVEMGPGIGDQQQMVTIRQQRGIEEVSNASFVFPSTLPL